MFPTEGPVISPHQVTIITTQKLATHKENLSKQNQHFTHHAHSHKLHGLHVQLQPVIILQPTITNHATHNIIKA